MSRKGYHFQNFPSIFFTLMPGGRARGNPVQNFSENSQKILSTDWKNILCFDITMCPSFKCTMNFGPSPLGSDFGIFGPLHNGMSRTIKIFKKVELWVSMARLTPNLVNASQKKWKQRKKGFEIGGIWTPDQPQMNKK